MVESKYYFDNGLSWHVACAGDEVKSLRTLEKLFGVHLVARENWVQISGEEDAVARASAFFDELSHFYQIRRKQLETRDFEFLCRSFRDRSEGDIRELMKERIDVSPKKREVLPRSRRQLEYVRAIRRLDVVFGIGPAGTGKTYLAMALAVSEFLKGNVSRIVRRGRRVSRARTSGSCPAASRRRSCRICGPLYDALYDMMSFDEVSALIERGVIEVAPLAFMRGRTLNNAFIILDEAQNTTVEQMLMFLTRMGFNSRCVITGDPSQSDLTGRERSGLLHAIDTLRSVEEIGFVFFDTRDVVRHALLEKIILAYNGTEQES